MLRKLAVTVLLFVILGAGIVIALPKLIPFTSIEKIVKDKVREATGRELAFSGAKLVFFPDVAIALNDASLSNASWAKDKHMLEVGRLDVALALTPLFQKKIEVKRFILKSPVVHLEKNAEGHGNWEFAAAVQDSKAAKPSAPTATAPGFKFKLGAVKVTEGSFSFADRAKNAIQTAENVDLDVTFPDFDSALQLKGTLDYRAKRVALELDVEKPAALLEGKPSKGTLKVKTDELDARVAGILATGGTLLKGSIDADVSSLSRLVAWAGGAPVKKLPFEKVSFKSGAEATASQMNLSNATLSLDEVEARGSVGVTFSGKPAVTARVSVGKLKLDRFMGGADTSGTDGIAAAVTPPSKKIEGWDATPIDFSGLKSIDADLVLETQGFSVKDADVGPSTLTVKLNDGVLTASSTEATLYGGKFGSSLTVNASGAPHMAFKFSMDGVQAQPVLSTFADFKKLSGTADASVDVTASGASQKDIIGNLAGKGSVVFRNGALEGIDLVNVAKMIQSRLASMNVGQGKTDFVEMGGTFTIAKGVAHNADLKMRGPLVQATGAGDIDLPRKYVSYRVIPVLTASSGAENATGFSVPVDIRGPFADISILPDYKAVIGDVMKDPTKVRDTVKNIAKDAKPMLKELQKNPAAALQNLLGGGFPQAEPAPVPPAEQPPAAETTPPPAQ